MRSSIIILSIILSVINGFGQKKPGTGKPYFPAFNNWERRDPVSVGLKKASIDSTIRYAIAGESKNPRDLALDQANTFGKAPFGEPIGPMANRGHATGIIIYKGYIVAEWGEPYRCDMVHSVTKSFLSTVIGKAIDSGLIRSVMDTVVSYIPPVEINGGLEEGKPVLIYPFETKHNRTITWNDLLRQTSDWEGTLWGKPEWADRPDSSSSDWKTRPRFRSGSVYEYNDVRVNALALAGTSIWRKPLPQVLKQYIMDPIGASNTWRWTGYHNSWITLDGEAVQSVSGGGHWGGGIFMNAYDMARFGLLTLHKGNWNGKQLISKSWIGRALTPTPVQTDYGFMNYYLNIDQKRLPSAPPSAYMHLGNGNNIIYVDPDHDLVIVLRWVTGRSIDGIVKRMLEAF
jgi:hypothetical protein